MSEHFYRAWFRRAASQGLDPGTFGTTTATPPPPSLTPRVARVPDPPRPQETPSEGAFRAALQLTEERTLMRVAEVAEHLARSEPEKATRDIYAAFAQALRREVKL